jgi:hypothetical protein
MVRSGPSAQLEEVAEAVAEADGVAALGAPGFEAELATPVTPPVANAG